MIFEASSSLWAASEQLQWENADGPESIWRLFFFTKTQTPGHLQLQNMEQLLFGFFWLSEVLALNLLAQIQFR